MDRDHCGTLKTHAPLGISNFPGCIVTNTCTRSYIYAPFSRFAVQMVSHSLYEFDRDDLY